jgi:hypothetical protein
VSTVSVVQPNRPVEPARSVHVGRRELVHAEAADVIDALGSDPRARLPDREDRTLGVFEDGHAAEVHHVEGVVDHGASEPSRARGSTVRVGAVT